jgi:hypothetical protein
MILDKQLNNDYDVGMVKKHLVNNEKEYIDLFKDFDVYEAEDFLGVEFGFVDGKFQSDIWDDDSIDESQEVSFEFYRKTENSNFPEEYPCLVLLNNEKGFDRMGPYQIRFMDFVYLKDFGKS